MLTYLECMAAQEDCILGMHVYANVLKECVFLGMVFEPTREHQLCKLFGFPLALSMLYAEVQDETG